jgi:CheY-like chemotaxis protein
MDLGAARHIVRGDSTRLQQVFWNLINNAIKFTPDEGTIIVRSSNTDDGQVRVEITDTGAGIDPVLLPKLFTAFEQGDVRAARKFAGLGLGLAISRKLAEAHGGTITASSMGRGHGSTFTVDLPAQDEFARNAATPSERPATHFPSAARVLNVLLVEDHEPTLRALERLLRKIGHRVTGVTSVASASAAAAHDWFDLIISDLGLPDGSGLDLMRQLREPYSGRAIALTGYGMESDIEASREVGFTEHLTKPVDMAALDAAIRRVAPC